MRSPRWAESLRGNWRSAASTTIAQYVLPRMLGEFLAEHPRVQPSLISGNTERIVEAAAQHEIGLGFIEGPSRSRDVKSEPFLVDELVLIVPAAHEWAERAQHFGGGTEERSFADAGARFGHEARGGDGFGAPSSEALQV